MGKREYILPAILGIIFVILCFIFDDAITTKLATNPFSNELFTFSSMLFGLILTSYAILFGLIPALRDDFKKSDTLREINVYFKICLLMLLIEIILSLIYSFITFFYLFVANMFFVGFILGMFAEIILLINVLFAFITKEN